jgi:hypothetical protein
MPFIVIDSHAHIYTDARVTRVGEERIPCRVLVLKTDRKPLASRGCGWEVVLTFLMEWEDVDWIYVKHDTGTWRIVVNTIMCLRVP